jgi:hypothetical protein
MPKDKREFCGSVSVRIDTTRCKLELSPAERYGGGEGLFRVRIGRRWIDAPPDGDGAVKPLFFDRARLADLIAAHAFGEAVTAMPEGAPDIPRNSRVTVKFWHKGEPWSEGVFTSSPPWRGFDGRFYVWVMTYKAGFVAVPVEDVEVHHARR